MSSKKHRKKALSFYQQKKEIIYHKSDKKIITELQPKEELSKKDDRKWLDISTTKKEDLPSSLQILEQIKIFMAGVSEFVIYTKKPTQAKFVGAFVQSGGYKNKFEVFPHIDKILFSVKKDGSVDIAYIRVYSDFPPSVSEFSLNEVEKVEELIPEVSTTT